MISQSFSPHNFYKGTVILCLLRIVICAANERWGCSILKVQQSETCSDLTHLHLGQLLQQSSQKIHPSVCERKGRIKKGKRKEERKGGELLPVVLLL